MQVLFKGYRPDDETPSSPFHYALLLLIKRLMYGGLRHCRTDSRRTSDRRLVDIRGLFRSACLSRLDPLTAPSLRSAKTRSLRQLYGEGFSLKVFSTIRRETPRTWRSDSQFWRGTMDGCSECLTVAVLGRCPCKRPLVLRSGQIRLRSTVCFTLVST